jgi:hypothetical protein
MLIASERAHALCFDENSKKKYTPYALRRREYYQRTQKVSWSAIISVAIHVAIPTMMLFCLRVSKRNNEETDITFLGRNQFHVIRHVHSSEDAIREEINSGLF